MTEDKHPVQTLPVKKRKPTSFASEEDSPSVVHIDASDQEEYVPAQKRVSITTSKILGTAQPHKPRVGPRYQADLPPLPQPRPAPGAPL
jgi:hypothetical protein